MLIEREIDFARQDPDEYVIRNGKNLDWSAFRERVDLYKEGWDTRFGRKLAAAMLYYKQKRQEGLNMDEARKASTEAHGVTSKFVEDAVEYFISKVMVAAARDEFGVRRKNNAELPWMTKAYRDMYRDMYKRWSSRTRKYHKQDYIARLRRMEQVCGRGHIGWVEDELRTLGMR